jgi:hypothetical protein
VLAPLAVSEVLFPAHTDGAAGAIVTVGKGFTVMVCVVVLLPLLFVAVSEMVYVPAVLKQMLVGFCTVDDPGVPPGNVHDQLVGELVLLSVKLIQVFLQKFV